MTFTSSVASGAVVNLTGQTREGELVATLGSSGIRGKFVNGALLAEGAIGSGSGQFRDIVRLQGTPQQSGFNRDSGPDTTLDESFLGGNTDLLLSELAEDRTGTAYVFSIDFNEGGNSTNGLISLDQFKVYVGPDNVSLGNGDTLNSFSDFETALGIGDSNSNTDVVYDLGDNTVLWDGSLASGSGSSDLNIYIPKSFFGDAVGTDYVYVYAEMGGFVGVDGVYVAGSGDDSISTPETAPAGDENNPFTALVPEPSSSLYLILFAGIVASRRQRT